MEIMRSIFWRDTEAVEPRAPLRSPLTCDVCVVGAGYTGLWTAYMLAREEPAATLCVIDAEHAGAGASGHNDGFVTPTVGKDLSELVRHFGISQTKAVTTTVAQSVLEIGRFCRTHDVNADYSPSGYLMAAIDRAQLRRLQRDRELVRRMGGQANELDAEEAQARIGSPLLLGATPVGGATINPHKLVRGLARVVAELGATVYENTPALDIEKHSGRYRVRTPHASIDAGTVVVATDAYQHRFKPFRRGVVPVWSYVMVTEPLTDAQLERVAWPRREGLVEARTFLRCARLTADNRVVWAGGRVRHWMWSEMEHRHLADRSAYRRLRASFEEFFPMWRDIPTSHAWGGCMGITPDLVPHFGSRDGLVYGYGYCGNGIAASHTGGKVLRDLVLGKQTEYSELPFVNRSEARLPAGRWRTHIGVRLRTETIARRDAR